MAFSNGSVLRPGAAHGWLPHQTGGANYGTQYPRQFGGVSHRVSTVPV